MTKKSESKKFNVSDNSCKTHNGSAWGAYYGLGAIGAAVYFVMQATGFWATVLSLLKALVWPAYIVFGLLQFLF